MQLKPSYNEFLSALQEVYEKDEAVSIRTLIFEWAANIGRPDVLISPQKELSDKESKKISDALERLLKQEPVQYITGEAWFCNLIFKVTPAVLIPRHETEELVHEALTFLKDRPGADVLDIGTGSGCIPISIKKNFPGAIVSAIDISAGALAIATENSQLLDTPVNFFSADILKEDEWNKFGLYDIIISNPPYIPLKESKEMHKNVMEFEPHNALFVPDDDPLLFYKKIADFANYHLKGDGKLFFETHETYAKEVAAALEENGFAAQIKKDIPGKERMVIASRYR